MDTTQILRKIGLVKAQCPEGALRDKLMKPLVAELEKAAEAEFKDMEEAAKGTPPKK